MVVPHSWFVTGTCWWRARAVPASTPGDAGRGVRRLSAAARPAASLGLVGLGGGSLGGLLGGGRLLGGGGRLLGSGLDGRRGVRTRRDGLGVGRTLGRRGVGGCLVGLELLLGTGEEL